MVEWIGSQESFLRAHKRVMHKLLKALATKKVTVLFMGHCGARATMEESAADSLRQDGLIERVAYDRLTRKGRAYLKKISKEPSHDAC